MRINGWPHSVVWWRQSDRFNKAVLVLVLEPILSSNNRGSSKLREIKGFYIRAIDFKYFDFNGKAKCQIILHLRFSVGIVLIDWASTLRPLRSVQKYAACLLYLYSKFTHITLILRDLPWLFIELRFHLKIFLITYKILHCPSAYLSSTNRQQPRLLCSSPTFILLFLTPTLLTWKMSFISHCLKALEPINFRHLLFS